ncbi:DUF397 domain-containing protein, partial [Kitasatospora sp. NPDC056076]|uniref:DUF397 domain-containing protein n=1 Tax=Kitasatospora sp. NPDC056076 TaxID=3345703 RepID=UPI0035E3B87A
RPDPGRVLPPGPVPYRWGRAILADRPAPRFVPVRDPENPGGPAFVLPSEAWVSFVAAVAAGELPTT